MMEVKRVSGRCMYVKIPTEKGIVNVVSAYAHQVGCTEEETDTFFEELEDLVRASGVRECLITGANLDGNVGMERTGFEKYFGGNGYGLEFVGAMDMMISKTRYKKKEERLITNASGGARSQIDYLLTRREHKHIVEDCKVLPGEAVVSQYKLVATELRIVKKIKSKLRGI